MVHAVEIVEGIDQTLDHIVESWTQPATGHDRRSGPTGIMIDGSAWPGRHEGGNLDALGAKFLIVGLIRVIGDALVLLDKIHVVLQRRFQSRGALVDAADGKILLEQFLAGDVDVLWQHN